MELKIQKIRKITKDIEVTHPKFRMESAPLKFFTLISTLFTLLSLILTGKKIHQMMKSTCKNI